MNSQTKEYIEAYKAAYRAFNNKDVEVRVHSRGWCSIGTECDSGVKNRITELPKMTATLTERVKNGVSNPYSQKHDTPVMSADYISTLGKVELLTKLDEVARAGNPELDQEDVWKKLIIEVGKRII